MDDLRQFNCARCGSPAYNHGPAHAPDVCDEYLSPQRAARNHVIAKLDDALNALRWYIERFGGAEPERFIGIEPDMRALRARFEHQTRDDREG